MTKFELADHILSGEPYVGMRVRLIDTDQWRRQARGQCGTVMAIEKGGMRVALDNSSGGSWWVNVRPRTNHPILRGAWEPE